MQLLPISPPGQNRRERMRKKSLIGYIDSRNSYLGNPNWGKSARGFWMFIEISDTKSKEFDKKVRITIEQLPTKKE
jgi:hypothetical protein